MLRPQRAQQRELRQRPGQVAGALIHPWNRRSPNRAPTPRSAVMLFDRRVLTPNACNQRDPEAPAGPLMPHLCIGTGDIGDADVAGECDARNRPGAEASRGLPLLSSSIHGPVEPGPSVAFVERGSAVTAPGRGEVVAGAAVGR
jgi:hypothetical protein